MKAWEIVSAVLTKVVEHVEPGVTTGTLNSIAEEEIKRLGAASYNKGYHPSWSVKPFPESLCTNLNCEIAHGIPNYNISLFEGDILTLDIGIIAPDGQCGDAAIAVPVGKISKENEVLLHYAKKILYAGIARIKEGVTLMEIASAMERVAMERKLLINRVMAGHGIGDHMHMDPDIPQATNRNTPGTKEYDIFEKHMSTQLKAGQIICLEPCVTNGKDAYGIKDEKSGWTWYTQDRANSAMFEHMIRVLPDGYEILTNHFEPFKKTW